MRVPRCPGGRRVRRRRRARPSEAPPPRSRRRRTRRRAVTIVAPFPPGGVADLTARPVAASLERTLKQPVVVVNKTGAAGAVGMQFVATSKPDGYTLLLALSSISIIPEADKLFGRQPAYTVDQLVPIALVSADPTVLVVRAESPWKTAKEFIDDARKRPDEISYSSSGIYGTLHMAMELLSHAADVKLRHVPHAGAAPALTAILGGHVDALASGPAVVLPHVKSGQAARARRLGRQARRRAAGRAHVQGARLSGRRVLHLGRPLRAARHARSRCWRSSATGCAWPLPIPSSRRRWTSSRRPITFKQGAEFQAFFDADARRLAEGVRKVGPHRDQVTRVIHFLMSWPS